ncbi:MAG: hypothetical protein KF678_07585 [Phycisphaeraceae bacterium]|nr:hypothetical protein [Phycisphaeraceae bacterium]
MLRAFTSAAILSAAALGLLAGCASNKGACCDSSAAAKSDGNVAVVNTMCPIGADDFETKQRPPELARNYKGTSIGFCCEGCVKSFDKMSEEKKAEVAKAALANKAL